MNQTEREYRAALDGLRFSQGEKERMMKNLIEQQEQKPVKRRSVRPLRAGLIAACLCLALVGTTFAATAAYQLMVRVHADKEIDGQHYVGFQVYGGYTQFPLSAFSQELIAAYEANQDPFHIVQPTFATREEAWDFLGRSIPCIWARGDEETWYQDGDDMGRLSEDYGCRVMLWQNDETMGLDGVEVYYYLESVSGAGAMVDMKVLTETMEPPEGWDGSLGGMLEYQDHRVEQLESYTMPNGTVAEIVMIYSAQKEPVYSVGECYGNFVYEGIFYQVRAHGSRDMTKEELVDQLHALLDSFQ